jgi:hypothetical protein
VHDWSAYFHDLLQANARGEYFDGSIDQHCQHFHMLFKAPSEACTSAAVHLNNTITRDEVVHALKKLGMNKAAGADSMPGEFLRNAYWEERVVADDGNTRLIRHYVLADALTCMFNKVLKGTYPNHWSTGVLVPVPKANGGSQNMDDYRGITIGMAVSKLYALVILARMDKWAETNGLRACTQFGFRSKMGTSDAVFAIRHIVDMQRERRKPVFAAFIDFKKAYDTVDRQLLWRCLEGVGLHGECLSTLKQMYDHVQLQVKVHGELGDAFLSQIGVKQGDPLSPLLFGLFIDRLDEFLAVHAGEVGLVTAGQRVRVLIYADDLVLLAEEESHLQKMLDILGNFCDATNLAVNVSKCEVVVFNRNFWGRDSYEWLYRGSRMVISSAFTYLGIDIGEGNMGRHMKKAMSRNIERARGCLFAMMQRCHNIRLYNPHVLNRLFNSLVLPVMSFGCEVWGPDAIVGAAAPFLKGEAEGVHRLFMRMSLWAGKATPIPCMMHDLGRVPIMVHWLKSIFQFWNRIVRRGQSDLTYKMLLENITLREGWAAQVVRVLNTIGIRHEDMTGGAEGQLLPFENVDDIVSNVAAACGEAMWRTADVAKAASGNVVRCCPDGQHEGFKIFKYKNWFALSQNVLHKDKAAFQRSFAGMVFKGKHVRVLGQFRYGMHWLNTEKCRAPDIGRSRRTCQCCRSGEREDELHVMTCDAYRHIRHDFPLVFGRDYERMRVKLGGQVEAPDVDDYIKACFNGEGHEWWSQFADFLIQSQRVRQDMIAGGNVLHNITSGLDDFDTTDDEEA